MKGKKSNKSKWLSHKQAKPKLSSAEAIAKTLAPKQSRQPKVLKVKDNPVSEIEQIEENTYNDNDIIDLRETLTVKELRFLDLYLLGEENVDKALIQAGYVGYHPHSLYRLGRSIVQKYERQAEDTKKIFQDIGFGQATIAQGIKDKALNAKSEMVSLNAYQLAARCTRMLEEPAQSHQGVNIIINCGTEPAGGPGAPARPINVSIQGEPLPAKPLQITK